MTTSVLFVSEVLKIDVPSLDADVLSRIHIAIDQKLKTHPDMFGKPLRQSLRSHRSLRVGDFRIVYRIDGRIVRIVAIRHRRDVYAIAEKRI